MGFHHDICTTLRCNVQPEKITVTRMKNGLDRQRNIQIVFLACSIVLVLQAANLQLLNRSYAELADATAIEELTVYVIDDWNGFAYHDQESLKRLLAHCAALPEEGLARLGCNAQSTAKQLMWGMWNVGGSLEESV